MLLFSSCSIDKIGQDIVNDGLVEFSSNKKAALSDKAESNSELWEGDERIGIFMMRIKSTSVLKSGDNVEYSVKYPGETATFISTNPIYYSLYESTKVKFIGYSPYQDGINNLQYMINLNDQSNLKALDLIVALNDNNGIGFDKNTMTPVNLEFKHRLTKFVVKLVAGDDNVDLSGKITVTFKNMYTNSFYSFNYDNFNSNSNQSDITAFKKDNTTFEAILLPIKAINNKHIVEFTVGEDIYSWQMSDNIAKELLAGTLYNYSIVLNKNGFGVTGTIENWDVIEGIGIVK